MYYKTGDQANTTEWYSDNTHANALSAGRKKQDLLTVGIFAMLERLDL